MAGLMEVTGAGSKKIMVGVEGSRVERKRDGKRPRERGGGCIEDGTKTGAIRMGKEGLLIR